MARRLPDEPYKRRLQVFKRAYQHMSHWQALMEDRGMPDIITDEVTGEDIYLGDLMVGIDSLPPRQRQAFLLICVNGYTETAARDELLPNSKSSTPVQQYADSGLVRMVEAYDLKQAGHWPPPEQPKPIKRKTKRRSTVMAALHPLLRKHLEDAKKDIMAQIDALKTAAAQVDLMLTGAEGGKNPTQPAPTPKPEGKPDLDAMARELAATG